MRIKKILLRVNVLGKCVENLVLMQHNSEIRMFTIPYLHLTIKQTCRYMYIKAFKTKNRAKSFTIKCLSKIQIICLVQSKQRKKVT
ncbi:CLUMA_CG018831, isoform A [Clunio marinus]|uniref:CLUMA_CG018831, isoform A n=1 Tax=Clunio marinus TaxID=568069 RepID=A0A1J1IZW1_9DIPT|nr:CLUMA_CG018831, isoform A [Clunio marinus]